MFEYSHSVCKDCGQVFEKISGKYREVCTECEGKTEPLKVVASWGICNTASLNVFKVEHGIEDKMLVGINDNRPVWCEINEYIDYDREGEDETHAGIKFGETVFFLDECLIV